MLAQVVDSPSEEVATTMPVSMSLSAATDLQDHLISLGRIPRRLRRRKLGPAYPQYPAACGGVIYFR